MKKFSTLLLLLLVSLVGGVNASAIDAKWDNKYVSSVSEAITGLDQLEDGYYILRNVGRQTFLRENDNNTLWLWNATNGSAALADVQNAFVGINKSVMGSVVCVSKNSDYYTIQFQSGKYIGTDITPDAADGGQGKSVATAGEIEIIHIGGNAFGFRPKDDSWADGNGNGGHTEGSFTNWGTTTPTSTTGNSAYQFFKVKLGDCVNCTFTAKIETETVATKLVKYEPNQTVTNPFEGQELSYFYSNPTFAETDLVATADNHTFTVNYTTGTVPFEFSTAAAPVWYNIYFRNSHENNAIVLGSSDTNVATGNNNKVEDHNPFTAEYLNGKNGYDSFNGGLWAFVRDGFGVKVLNKLTGKYLTFANANNAVATLGNGTALIVKTNSTYSGAGFSLQYPGVSDSHVGDHCSGKLGLWKQSGTWNSQNDGGSCFQIVPATSEDIVNVGKVVLNTTLDGLTPVEADANCVTALTAASIAKAKTFVSSATTVAALDAAYEVRFMPVFEEGAFYRIKNSNVITKKYLSTSHMFVGTDGTLAASYNKFGDYNATTKPNGVDRHVRRVTEDSPLVPQLWQFVENVGRNTFKVKNANNGCRLSSYVAPIDMPIDVTAGGDYTFKMIPTGGAFSGDASAVNTNFLMYVNGKMINAYAGDNGTGIQEWNDINDKGGYWQFIKVTEIPVTISEAAGWASVALPCAVQVPAVDGLKAYYAKSVNGDRMQLEEVPGGIVPANQGFLLAKEGGADVNLQILTGCDATLEGNLLQPATAKRAGFEAESTYVLAKDGDDVAFLQSTLTTVPANKAYLNAADAVSHASVLSFSFGDATGINDAVNADAEKVTYYDLNGRVVLYPQHGIFVTSKGQKVLIK